MSEWHEHEAKADSRMVVLTVAHLDHTPEHCTPDNLRVWCQRCHLTYDAREHAESRARRAREELEREGQGRLPIGNEAEVE